MLTMRYRDDANKIIVSAEAALRSLAEQALVDRAYADVAHIASLADSLRGLSDRAVTEAEKPAGRGEAESPEPKAAARQRPRQANTATRSRRGYPRFERDGDKLVKVGWSKKSREEYEHRAPRKAVEAFTDYLSSKVKLGQAFLIEDLLPVNDGADGELPSYQVYLTLAWLRDLGVVKKLGREGYAIQKDMANGGLSELWERTEARLP